MLALDKRQSLETLTRDERTARCVLVQLKDKYKDLDQKKDRLAEDAMVHSGRKTEVRLDFLHIENDLTSFCSWSSRST